MFYSEDDLYDFFMPGMASVIVGGQFGSEAKGLAAGIVSRRNETNVSRVCTTNAGAQAGHTTVLEDGKTFVCYHLPTIGVLDQNSVIYLNAGSIIDPELLMREIQDVGAVTGEDPERMAGRIMIHPNAAVITDSAKLTEKMGATTHLGSTQKGVGAALAAKIMRRIDAVASECKSLKPMVSWLDLNRYDGEISVEIPQGTGLSLNASRFYPKCTSRDCWVGQGLTDAGLHPSKLYNTLMVCRTLPIRVGHIYDDQGNKVGDSGPFFSDSRELDWERDLPGINPERTTVTKRVRRIATWSREQYLHSLRLNRPTHVLLTFTNYLTEDELVGQVKQMNEDARIALGEATNLPVLFSWGPKVSDVTEDLDEALTYCRVG